MAMEVASVNTSIENKAVNNLISAKIVRNA